MTDLPDDFDQELADALRNNHSLETITENAVCVATFYNTLVDSEVPHDSALELTHQWFASMLGEPE